MRTLLATIIATLSFTFIMAQVPQALNYQAVARSVNGVLIPSQPVAVRFSILDATVNGNVVYQETQSTTTNSYGLFTLSIGKGTAITGAFSSVNWGTGDKYLKVEISPEGGTNYTVQGTTQLLSVPYALYANRTNLVAGNAIAITNGNTIAANYQAGPGVSIAGNVISANAANLWTPDTYGIHNVSGNVGVGQNSQPNIPVSITSPNTGLGYAGLHIRSQDVWHTALSMFNNVATSYSFFIGGSLSTDVKPGNFAIYNHSASSYVLHATQSTNNVGIGSTGPAIEARSKLHVFNGDVNVDQIGSGIIMKSPNGQCWRVTVSNTGSFVSTSIGCP